MVISLCLLYKNLANPTQLIGQNFVRFNDIVSDKAAEVSTRNQQYDKAMNRARMSVSYNSNKKGITVLDFDDTVAISNSMVIVNMPVKDPDILDIAARRKFGNTVFKNKQDFSKNI